MGFMECQSYKLIAYHVPILKRDSKTHLLRSGA
jgi:hypothetical protein